MPSSPATAAASTWRGAGGPKGSAKRGETTPRQSFGRGGIEMRAIIVREAVPVTPSGPTPSFGVVYDGDLAAYEGGLGAYDEGDVHVWRTAIVNLTPHAIRIIGETQITIPPSGIVARCFVRREKVGEVGSVPVNRTVFGDIEGLPDPRSNTYYIVSAIVAQACPDRHDLLIPDDTVRDDQGRIIGCRALATVAQEGRW